MDQARILVPVRYAAWLAGDLGLDLTTQLQNGLGTVPALRITRLPRGFLVEADESMGPLVEQVAVAMGDLENGVQEAYPMFHAEMGPVWTGTLQAVFS
jgi:hypothetical protein